MHRRVTKRNESAVGETSADFSLLIRQDKSSEQRSKFHQVSFHKLDSTLPSFRGGVGLQVIKHKVCLLTRLPVIFPSRVNVAQCRGLQAADPEVIIWHDLALMWVV